MKLPLAIAGAVTGLAVGLAAWLPSAEAPVLAQEERFPPEVACPRPLPLMPVGGTDPEVVKRVSPPALLLTRNNWNTDFVVPPGLTFTSYRVNLFFKNAGTYNVEMYLKYGDGTADSFFDRERVVANQDDLLQVPGYPRRRPGATLQPSQVNVKVGNTGSMGKVYVVSVDACR